MSGRLDSLLTAVLTHPGTMAVKRPIKDACWRLRGLVIRNPELPRDPRSWVFVCKGNICRSPFAARLAEQLLAKAHIDGVTCTSAGLDVSQGNRPPDAAIEVGGTYGLSLEGHRPLSLSTSLVERSDVVVAMEAQQLVTLREVFPRQTRRFILLPLFASDASVAGSYQRFNIADPYGKPRHAFEHCYTRIEDALTRMLVAAYGRRDEWAADRIRTR